MAPSIEQILSRSYAHDVSDVHILADSLPRWRSHGKLAPVSESSPIQADTILGFHTSIRPGHPFNGDDFSFDHEGRFWRGNASLSSSGPKLSLRLIPDKIPDIAGIGLPSQFIDEINRLEGMHLVTGPTGSGKTTTLSAILRHLASLHPIHIITLEDPIEQRHPTDMLGLIVQRERGVHFAEFGDSVMRGTLRQDPDVILFGELRDRESIRAALTAAETGHMVLGTLHNDTAKDAVSRLLDACSDDGRTEHASQLSKILRTVIAQRLVPTRDGTRIAAVEYLKMTPSCQNLVRQGNYHRLPDEMSRGTSLGMQTLSSHLVSLCRSRRITRETALSESPDPNVIESLLPPA